MAGAKNAIQLLGSFQQFSTTYCHGEVIRKKTMNHHDLYAATLGLFPPWRVSDVRYAHEERRLFLDVAYDTDKLRHCPHCSSDMLPCTETICETWQHDDYFHFVTYLHAHIPQLECPSCGILAIDRPWARADSRFAPLPPQNSESVLPV